MPTCEAMWEPSVEASSGFLLIDRLKYYCKNWRILCSIWWIFNETSYHSSTWVLSGPAQLTSRPSVPWEHWGLWDLYEQSHGGRAWE